MKCLHLSTYTFPSFSTSTFPFPSSLSFHSPSSIPILPTSSWKTHQFIQWRFLQDQVKATQLIAIDFLFGQRKSCQSGKLVARGKENDWEGDMWMVLFIWVRTRHLNHSHDNYLNHILTQYILGVQHGTSFLISNSVPTQKRFRPWWTMPGSPGGPNSSAA